MTGGGLAASPDEGLDGATANGSGMFRGGVFAASSLDPFPRDLAMTRALAVVAVVAAVGVAWVSRDAPWARRLEDRWPGHNVGETLVTPPAGVHKCRQADGQVVYSDRGCERGTREQAMGGGTMTNVPALGPRPAPSAASAGLVPGFDPATIDRLREQQIDAAANR